MIVESITSNTKQQAKISDQSHSNFHILFRILFPIPYSPRKTAMTTMSNKPDDYEQERLRNIAQNEQFLASLGLSINSPTIITNNSPIGMASNQSGQPLPSLVQLARSDTTVMATRRTTRASKSSSAHSTASTHPTGSGAAKSKSGSNDYAPMLLRKKLAPKIKTRSARLAARSSLLKQEKTNGSIDSVDSSDTSSSEDESSEEEEESSAFGTIHLSGHSSFSLIEDKDQTTASVNNNGSRYDGMQCHEGDICSVIPSRITSMLFHPQLIHAGTTSNDGGSTSEQKALLFVGDKNGNLSLVHVDIESADKTIASSIRSSSLGKGIVNDNCSLRLAHSVAVTKGQQNITAMSMLPGHSDHLLLSSYDGSLRILDLQANAIECVWRGSGSSYSSNGRSSWQEGVTVIPW